MTTAVRDSSADYRTYWLQGGQYYSRMRNLGDSASCALPADKLSQIPGADRKVVLIETGADPVFCRTVSRIMSTDHDWVHTISRSAKQAVANELDPRMFSGSRGSWPKLRELVRALTDEVASAASRGLVPTSIRSVSGLGGLGSLGQWDIIGTLVGSIGGAAAAIYGARLQSDTQKDLARIQADAAMRAAQSQMATYQAQQALAAQNPVGSMITNLTTASVAGIPLLLIIPAIGAAIYFATKK